MSKTTEIIIKMEEAKDRGDQATIDRLEAKYPGFFGKPACLLYTSPSPRDRTRSRMPSSA